MSVATEERSGSANNFEAIQPSVAAEIDRLFAEGVDISVVDIKSPEALDPARQAFMDQQIAELEELANSDPAAAHAAFTDPSIRPGMFHWAFQRMRAIALHPLYNATRLLKLGDGINPDAFDRPLFGDGLSARERIEAEKGAEKAEQHVAGAVDFIDADIDEATREMFQGCYDGRAVNTRAIAAFGTFIDHLSERGILRKDLKVASLACGAAGRVYTDLVGQLESRGHEVEEVHLLDKDVIALSCAHALADEDPELQSKLSIHEVNLLMPNFVDCIEPNSLDVVDLLGLFEYFPSNVEEMANFLGVDPSELDPEQDYNEAAKLLANAGKLLKPGGQIVFGNMLNERPQQVYFNQVVQWPRLFQRTITQVLDVIEAAGYSRDQVQVKIPGNEGVYAVYVITIPEQSEGLPVPRDVVAGVAGPLAVVETV